MPANLDAGGLWFLNGHVTVHLAQAANEDGISILEHMLPAEFGPPFHIHRQEDETFYVLEGEVKFKQADAVRIARQGETVYLAQGIPHGFKVVSPGGARALTVTRGGFERIVRAVSVPAGAPVLPQQIEPTPEMQAHLAEICARNGIDLIGPPIE